MPFCDGEIIIECISAVEDTAFHDKNDIGYKICLSQMNFGRRIENLSSNIAEKLKEKAANFQLFSLAMDESADVTQLNLLLLFMELTLNSM